MIPASDTMNWVKNSAAMAGAMWVIACMVTPTRPSEFCRRSVRITGSLPGPAAGAGEPPPWRGPPPMPSLAGGGSWSCMLSSCHRGIHSGRGSSLPHPGLR